MPETKDDITLEEDSQERPDISGGSRDYLGRFKKGFSGNPAGKPKGTVSPMTWIKSYFGDNPEDFDTFMMDYISDRRNERHIVEMIEGRPAQRINLDAELSQKKLIKLDE